jgi:lauroyl/myristoyl acyltransferase
MGTVRRLSQAPRPGRAGKPIRGRLVLYRICVALVRVLPGPLAYHGGRLVGTGVSFLPSNRRHALRANLAVAMDLPIDDQRVVRAGRAAMAHWVLNFVDLFRVGRADFPAMIQQARVDGWDFFNAAYARGKGVILVSAHFGPFETLVQLLVLKGIQVLIPVERLEPPELLDLICAGRTSLGMGVTPVGPETFGAMAATLKKGGVVVVVSDRDIANTGEPVCFFGRPVTLPSAAVLLALRTGAPLLGAFAHRGRRGVISGHFTAPIEIAQNQQRLANGKLPPRTLRCAVAEGTQTVANLLAREIRRSPSQWVVLQPIFAPRLEPRAAMDAGGFGLSRGAPSGRI